MGIIRAAVDTARGTLADQWLDVVEAGEMGEQTLFTEGVIVRQGFNRRGNSDVISNGSVIHVYDNQFMILTDGGKIIDYSAEPGYYTVDNGSAPSLFNGDLVGDVLKDSFNRFKFGGGKPVSMKVYFLNLQEIRGIRFGTRNPVNYFDNFYNSELFLRTHGSYSIKITDPVRFYTEVVPRNASHLEVDDINQQFLDEFLEALQSAISQMSVDGIRISHVTSKTRELSKYMGQVLDEDWKKARGIEIQSVGIASISYDEESQKLINMRNQGAMMGDPNIREGFVQSSHCQRSRGSRFQRQRSHGRLYGNGYGYPGSRRLHERGQQYEHAADAAAGPVPADDEPAAGSADAAGAVRSAPGRPTAVRRHLDLYLRSSQYRKLLPELRRPPSGSSRLDLYLRSSQHRKILSELRETPPVKEGAYVSSQL